ncbi:unnamed protein product [Sphagnum troendelagicum]|uniref:DUF1350 domain-containing protein n=1 Tax=Sphagnum troendelagicum TaxID=128251 RepID=A0ABP0U8K7_9BRYO
MAAVTGVPTHVMNSDRRYHHCDQRQSSQIPTSSSSSSTSTHCLLSHGVANQPILTPLVERRRNSLLAKMRLVIPPLQTNKFLQSKSSQKRKPSVQQIHSLKARSISEAAATESVQRIGAPPPYQRVGDCLVYPSKGKPKGLIHFLGGAFIGAAPDVTYSFFIELLAKEGFLIVATPYNVTFDHTVSAQVIQNRFNRCLDILSTSSRFLAAELSPDDVAALPIFSVGHSNGALMQVLIGSLCSDSRLPQANAIISFNNKPAADAVPFFDQMGPTMVQVAPLIEASPVTDFARAFTAEVIRAVLDSRIPLPPAVGDNLQSIRQFLDQIPAVFNQVAEGVSEFTPTPEQNKDTISTLYTIPNNLLVKFTVDTIDETDALEEILKPRTGILGGKLTKIVLNGTHATPLAPDVKWVVGREYTPIDAVAQVLKNTALMDLRSLVRTIGDFFISL